MGLFASLRPRRSVRASGRVLTGAFGLVVSFGLAACGGSGADPWDEALTAFEAARAQTPDYTDPTFDPVLERLDEVPTEHRHKPEALALAAVLRTERRVVARTGLDLAPGPPVEVDVERIEAETTRSATGTMTTP